MLRKFHDPNKKEITFVCGNITDSTPWFSYPVSEITPKSDRDQLKKEFQLKYKKHKTTDGITWYPFFRQWARDKALDNLLAPEDLKNAREFGLAPKGSTIHHIRPLFAGGKNIVSNFSVVHGCFHQFWEAKVGSLLNTELKLVFDSEEQKKDPWLVTIITPIFPRVVSENSHTHLLNNDELHHYMSLLYQYNNPYEIQAARVQYLEETYTKAKPHPYHPRKDIHQGIGSEQPLGRSEVQIEEREGLKKERPYVRCVRKHCYNRGKVVGNHGGHSRR